MGGVVSIMVIVTWLFCSLIRSSSSVACRVMRKVSLSSSILSTDAVKVKHTGKETSSPRRDPL